MKLKSFCTAKETINRMKRQPSDWAQVTVHTALPGACAARHCQGPGIQGQLPRENALCASGWCNITPASDAAGSPPPPLYPSLPTAWVSQRPRSSCSFNPVLSGPGIDALRRPTRRGGSKSKAELRELCEQGREGEISPSSLRSSGLKLHKQLDVPASVEYLNRQQIIPNSGGGLWEQAILIFPLFLFFCECICICFWVRFCLYSFAL